MHLLRQQRSAPCSRRRWHLPRIPILAIALACASLAPEALAAQPLPARVTQGQLVVAQTAAGSRVFVDGRPLRVSAAGRFVFGVARDRSDPIEVSIARPGLAADAFTIAVDPRAWPIERVGGVPPKTVHPPPEIAERIAREQARVAKARERDEAREDFAKGFRWPVQGRISGRFGSERRYNGAPGSPHSGLDIAAANGTSVQAPAAGSVSFADPDLYLTGGTLVIDHGHGVSSVFLHLSRIDVPVGATVRQGDVIAAVGATGRASGPHLHWGLNWFDIRLDPLLVLPAEGTSP